jgi:hypothetical protein
MRFKWQNEFLADFNTRYERWITARDSGDPAKLEAATAAISTLTPDRLANALAVIGQARTGEEREAALRAIIMGHEFQAEATRRAEKRERDTQRRRDRQVRLERTVEMPTRCARCGGRLANPKTTGRPRLYCSPACRKAAYEDRRAKKDGAIKVQVIERVVTTTEVREEPHFLDECMYAVLADDDTLIDLLRTLALLLEHQPDAYPANPATIRRLTIATDQLRDTLIRRTAPSSGVAVDHVSSPT